MLVLGIETSCDETAAGVVLDGRRVLSSVIHTQFDLHGPYGGVVPELASRRHVEAALPVIQTALRQAGIELKDLAGLAVSQGPGLVGALLVGLNLAKGVSFASGLPLAGVNHLEAHAAAGFLELETGDFPVAALVVSGGHTNFYWIKSPLSFELLGRTRDDAAGEAFDKVAKLMGLGYPGGRVIDELAGRGNPDRFELPRPMIGQGLDCSFSGLKTAVLQLVRARWGLEPAPETDLADLAASFQAAVVDVLAAKIDRLLVRRRVGAFILAGGVAANRGLRARVQALTKKRGVRLVLPPVSLCTDNGAMIAALGFHHLKEGRALSLDADAWSRWPNLKAVAVG